MICHILVVRFPAPFGHFQHLFIPHTITVCYHFDIGAATESIRQNPATRSQNPPLGFWHCRNVRQLEIGIAATLKSNDYLTLILDGDIGPDTFVQDAGHILYLAGHELQYPVQEM